MNKGIGLCSVVFIIFLVLKLTQVGLVANWSWIWVFSPLWIPTAISVILYLIMKAIPYLIDWYYKFFASEEKREQFEKQRKFIESMKSGKRKQSAFMQRLQEAQKIQEEQRKKNNR